MSEPIYVTRPSLPPLAKYVELLEQIWDKRVLTNGGPFHQQLEARLASYLHASAVSLTANGALALELAIQAADLSGEVITTPYSFVATTHSVLRENLRPVFVDIRKDDFNIDVDAIERAITPATSAIVTVHCYGNPCQVERIEEIAQEHGLRVIYDAAHAFGVRLNGRSLFSWGDMSTLSFHATKSYNTFEGGAVTFSDERGKPWLDRLKNFGIESEVSIPAVGTNAKMSELNAALGLLQLDLYEQVRAARREVDAAYRRLLDGIDGIEIPPIPAGVDANYSYFPLLVTERFGCSRDALYEHLKVDNIFSRRYFYPLLSNLEMYRDEPSARPENLPVANRAVEQILCLPIYPDLTMPEVERVAARIRTKISRLALNRR